MDMEARSLSQDKSRQLLSKVCLHVSSSAVQLTWCMRGLLPTNVAYTYKAQVCASKPMFDVYRYLVLQVKEYKADLASLKEQLKQAAAGASEGDAARAELGLGDNYYSTSGAWEIRWTRLGMCACETSRAASSHGTAPASAADATIKCVLAPRHWNRDSGSGGVNRVCLQGPMSRHAGNCRLLRLGSQQHAGPPTW